MPVESSTLGNIVTAIENAGEAGLKALGAIGGKASPTVTSTPVAVPPTPPAIAPQDVAKFATAFVAWVGKQEPTILAGLSIADTIAKFVAVFVPGAEAVDLGIEFAEEDIPIIYSVGTAALPFVSPILSGWLNSGTFAAAPDTRKPTGII